MRLALAAFLATLTLACAPPSATAVVSAAEPVDTQRATITRIIDGDTVEATTAAGRLTVRALGIDPPARCEETQ